MPRLNRIIETALYVDDLERARAFYETKLGLEPLLKTATLFARIEPVTATSVFGAGQTLESVTHRITLRRRDGVASGMRFARAGRIFDILTVHDPDESGRYLVCKVKEAGA